MNIVNNWRSYGTTANIQTIEDYFRVDEVSSNTFNVFGVHSGLGENDKPNGFPVTLNSIYLLTYEVRSNMSKLAYGYLMRASGGNVNILDSTSPINETTFTTQKIYFTSNWNEANAWILIGGKVVDKPSTDPAWFEFKNLKVYKLDSSI